MERPENSNSRNEQRRSVDSSIEAQLRAKGGSPETLTANIRVSNPEKEKRQGSLKKSPETRKAEALFGDVVADTIRNIDKLPIEKRERNHGGSGRQANGPILADAITSAQKTHEQTAEKLKEERRTKIVDELVKEWESKNGPMMQKPLGSKDTQMTDNASEFFFDHKGRGKFSVPRRADKILTERFPEYAEKIERQADKLALSEKLAQIQKEEGEVAKESVRLEMGKAAASKEVEEIKSRIKDAEESGQADIAKRWKIRLRKAEDVLALFDKVSSLITGPASEEIIVAKMRDYISARDKQAQMELKISGLSEPVTKEELDYTKKMAGSEWNKALSGKVFHDGIPVLTDVVGEGSKKHEADIQRFENEGGRIPDPIPTLTEVVSGPTEIEKVDRTAFDLTSENEAMQRDMDALVENVPEGESLVELVDTNVDKSITIMETIPTQAAANKQEGAIETPVVATAENAATTQEQKEAVTEKFELSAEAKENLSPEWLELVKTIEDNISALDTKVEERAEEAGMNPGIVRRTGEVWNSIPLRYKLLLSAGMLASGIGAAAVGATAATGAIAAIGTTMRFIGGAGAFVGFEKLLKDAAEKNGVERTRTEELRHTALAATLSILVVGVLPGFLRDYAVEHGAAEKLHSLFGSTPAQPTTPTGSTTGVENLAAAGAYIEVAQSGDTVWKMAEHQLQAHLGEKFTGLSHEQQTYLIDAVKDQVEQHPDQFGIENIDTLQVGQGIDFEVILNNKNFMDNTLSAAKGLSAEDIASIQNYSGEPAAGTPEVPVPQETPSVVEAGGLKVNFHYTNGVVDGYSSSEVVGFTQQAEAQKLLNSNWNEVVRNHGAPGTAAMDTSIVSGRANTLYQYDQVLNSLEQRGQGSSPEANFLREQLEKLVADTEKEYGDVFKDTADLFKPEQVVPTTEAPAVATTPEATPTDPQIIAASDKLFHNHIDDVFGSKGFLGFGAVDGTETPNWKDPEVGFGNKTIDQIMTAKPITLPGDEVKHFGIENPSAVNKMQDYLKQTFLETGVQPTEGETAEKYLKRVSVLSVMHK